MTPDLLRFDNFERFPKSHTPCPECGGETLRDEWPPNYGGGSLNQYQSISGSNIKHICLHCRIHFMVHVYEHQSMDGNPITVELPDLFVITTKTLDANNRLLGVVGYSISSIRPLVERDGKLLTPHDVVRYEYHDKHGIWPIESYG